jgi:hypothetical protein
MDLAAARNLVEQCITRMNQVYGRPVFDEWAIIRMESTPEVLAYSGPRDAEFESQLHDDLMPLRNELAEAGDTPGEFAFSREAEGTSADAFIFLGSGCYLICNNTQKSMKEVTADPLWLKAQASFVTLSERFGVDELR